MGLKIGYPLWMTPRQLEKFYYTKVLLEVDGRNIEKPELQNLWMAPLCASKGHSFVLENVSQNVLRVILSHLKTSRGIYIPLSNSDPVWCKWVYYPIKKQLDHTRAAAAFK